MRRIVISAMAPNRAIGFQGRLPWHLPEEYAHFLNSIKGKTMVMGRKSWEVFGADAQTAANIVVSRRKEVSGATDVADSLEAAIKMANEFGHDIFIAGGGDIYSQAIANELFDEIWLSTVHLDVEGDVFFPKLNLRKLTVSFQEDRGRYLFEKYIKK